MLLLEGDTRELVGMEYPAPKFSDWEYPATKILPIDSHATVKHSFLSP
jgi:hypothetical protein